ncbi:MAG: hypothetical protein KDD37_03155 [Bdellovibrionales bacterium]|nr:hypothetical protein [Bdellovibrionales bacterium]
MRSKFTFIGLLVSSFVLVLSFQNCGSVSENVPGGAINGPNSPGGGDINNCMAIAVPYLKYGFIFNSSAVPASAEIDINGEVAYSDCGHETGDGSVVREGNKLEFYQGFETINELAPNVNIKLYSKNCSSGARSEIFNADESAYDSYSLCGTNSVRMEVDFVVN